ncbi:MAG: hypothetical protein ACI9V1_002621 [Spirosomataceae bacterium]|jgi:hypothetical protein
MTYLKSKRAFSFLKALLLFYWVRIEALNRKQSLIISQMI